MVMALYKELYLITNSFMAIEHISAHAF